jgi:putative restriction endonuclease
MLRRVWTRNELIVAFNLYCKTPFGRIHTGNSDIVWLAGALRRSPSSVSWKLANFARLDPSLKQRNIQGATHGSKAEEEIWREFRNNWDALAYESELLLARLAAETKEIEAIDAAFPEGKTRDIIVQARVNQRFFRSAVLAAYDSKCCISGLKATELLVASHIVPWAADEKNRTNPSNGLCLSAIHDRAFDCGLISVTPDHHVVISKKLRSTDDASTQTLEMFFLQFEGKRISLPSHFIPDQSFLTFHNERIFQG